MWSLVERFVSQGLSFLTVPVVARLLTPDDYGLVTIVSVVTQILETLASYGGFEVG